MAGINNSEVFDIFHPTPVSLTDLSAMAVSQGIWRFEVMKYLRMDDALTTFNPGSQNISSKSVLPDLPSVIHATIDKYVTKFGFSIDHWLRSHFGRVFHFHYNHQNHVLRYFRDFVCDYNGTIHYVRTAERMMNCDQFDVQQKFIIACTYFFEDYIRRLWPFVSNNMDLKSIYFYRSPQLYYWICYLKNELEKIPTTPRWNNTVEEVMLDESMTHNRPSVEYFWNRMPAESRRRKAHHLFRDDVQSFARYILPKLDDQQLVEFVNVDEYGFEMMHALYKNTWYDKEFVLSIWMQIRNIMNERVFTNETMIILQFENMKTVGLDYDYCEYENDEDGCIRRNWFNLCCEIWNSAPERLKRSSIRGIISNDRLYGDLKSLSQTVPSEPKEYIFFSAFLSYATFDERRTFWSNYWVDLIEGTRCRDLQKIMNLCFANEHEISQFKENVMANSDNVRSYLSLLLALWYFDGLNDWASFLFSEVQSARNFKQRLLQEVLIDRNSITFSFMVRYNVKDFNQFIDDAYGNANLSANFKNQLMSLPWTQAGLSHHALIVTLERQIEFTDAFVSTEETLQQIKARIIDALKEKAAANKSVVSEPRFFSVLSWCLGSDEEAEKLMMNYL